LSYQVHGNIAFKQNGRYVELFASNRIIDKTDAY
jgi:hypothetical protein